MSLNILGKQWRLQKHFSIGHVKCFSSLGFMESNEQSMQIAHLKFVEINRFLTSRRPCRYTFVNEKVKRSARYYSPGWRTWAAVAIQLAWRRYRHRLTLTSLSFIRPRRPLSRCSSLGEDRLRLYTALLTSPKPNQDDFDF